jgi:hypothetical protein
VSSFVYPVSPTHVMYSVKFCVPCISYTRHVQCQDLCILYLLHTSCTVSSFVYPVSPTHVMYSVKFCVSCISYTRHVQFYALDFNSFYILQSTNTVFMSFAKVEISAPGFNTF